MGGKRYRSDFKKVGYYPFNAKFNPDDLTIHPALSTNQGQEVAEYLIQLGIQGLRRVLKTGLHQVGEVETELAEYEVTNDPILGFVQECEMEEFQIENEPKDVYRHYCEYCLANGYQRYQTSFFQAGQQA